jgi:hypothetical protein
MEHDMGRRIIMNRKLVRMIGFSIMLLFVSDLAFSKPPDWVNGRSNRFPEGLYLVGVGVSDSRKGAESEALASLAKVFRAQISQQTDELERYLQSESMGKTKIEQKKSLESLTKVSTDKVIEGAAIVETAQEESSFYALAVLDRLQSSAILTERIATLDQAAAESVHRARAASDKLSRIKNYKNAIHRLLLREIDNTDLAIINIKGSGIPAPIPSSQVVLEFNEWLVDHFLIAVKISGVSGEIVEKAIIESLIRDGFPVQGDQEQSDAKAPDLLVKGEVTLSPMEIPGQSFKTVRWCVDLTIVETKENRIVGVINRSGREGHLSEPEAKARALRILQPEVAIEVGRKLADYFTGESQMVKGPGSPCAMTEK